MSTNKILAKNENCHEGKIWVSNERGIFERIAQTPKDINPIGYKGVFVRKRNVKNKITRYKAHDLWHKVS